MPYIPEDAKKEMKDHINDLSMWIQCKGDLNYVICELVGKFISEDGDLTYTEISEKIDAVHDAEAELRRRILEPFEDMKMKKNGDVPSFAIILDQMKG